MKFLSRLGGAQTMAGKLKGISAVCILSLLKPLQERSEQIYPVLCTALPFSTFWTKEVKNSVD